MSRHDWSHGDTDHVLVTSCAHTSCKAAWMFGSVATWELCMCHSLHSFCLCQCHVQAPTRCEAGSKLLSTRKLSALVRILRYSILEDSMVPIFGNTDMRGIISSTSACRWNNLAQPCNSVEHAGRFNTDTSSSAFDACRIAGRASAGRTSCSVCCFGAGCGMTPWSSEGLASGFRGKRLELQPK